MGGHHGGGSHLGVGAEDLGVGRHLGGGLGALGGHGLLAVLDGGDVGDSLADSPGHLPGGGNRDLVTFLHRDRLTHWGSSSHGSHTSVTVARVSLRVSLGISLGISLSLSLAIASLEDRGGIASHSQGPGSQTTGHDLAVLTHHGAGVPRLGGGLLAGGCDDLLAVLGNGGVQDLVILLVTLLSGCLHLPGLTGGDGDTVTDRSR